MNNEYLRLNNADSQQDLSVNKYSAKLNAKNKANRQRQSSALGLIIDEVYSVQEKTELIQQESVKKPKILDAIFFSFIYLISLILLAFIVKTTKNLVLLYVLAMGSSFYIPLSFIYFFYRLDVRGKLKFSSIAYCVLIGFAIYLAIDFVFEKFVSQSTYFYMYVVTVRCVIELLSVVLVSFLIIETRIKVPKTSAILYACAVASGFVLAETFSKNFMSLLVKVEVYEFGSTVGAILNVKELIETSIDNLLSVLATNSVLSPLIFVMLSMIIIDIIVSDEWSVGKRTITMLFTFLFCCLTYVLTSINTPFNLLSFFYNAMSIAFSAFLFIRMINVCIASEKYE